MPSPIQVVSQDELQRIVGSVSSPPQTNHEARRLALKSLSENRTAKWPNTLEAMRAKKDRWKKDREDRAEAARLKIDETEARLQKEYQTMQVERANAMLNEQTDRMKTLRSKQLLTDVLHHRTLQMQEKKLSKEQENAIKRKYDEDILAQVVRENEEAAQLRKQMQQANLEQAIIQKQQLEEFKNRYIAELREEKHNAERIKQKCEEDLAHEKQVEEETRRRAKLAAEETQLSNMQLKVHRQHQKEMERLEDEKRQKAEEKKMARIRKREEMQLAKRERELARKQRMIDLATYNLIKLENKNEERLNNQTKEVREKEDKEFESRASQRAAENEAIRRSRQSQLQRKAQEIKHEQDMGKEAARQWEAYGRNIEKKLEQEEIENRLEHLKLAVIQKQQADARKKTLFNEKQQQIANNRIVVEEREKDNDHFQSIAKAAIEDAKALGIENIYPLRKALVEKSIDLLPASGFRI